MSVNWRRRQDFPTPVVQRFFWFWFCFWEGDGDGVKRERWNGKQRERGWFSVVSKEIVRLVITKEVLFKRNVSL